METAGPPFRGLPANTQQHAKNNDCIVTNEGWIGWAIRQYVCGLPQPWGILLRGIQMEPLSDVPTGRHQEKGWTRAGQLKVKIQWGNWGIYSLVPPMCHWGAIQHRSPQQVPDPDTQKCRKTRTCGVCRNLPSTINQLIQTWQLGPRPDLGGMDQDWAKGLEGYLNWPFQHPCKVLEHESLKQVKLCQPKL